MRIGRFGSVLAAMLLAIAPRPAAAQGPFMFTVTTEPLASERPWTARYAAGYGQQSSAPFGIDGVDSVLSIQGPLGRGLTLRGQAGLAIDGEHSPRATQEVELLKDLRPATRGVGLAMGVGLRREWQGATVILGRITAGHSFARSSLFGNLRLERALPPGRDRLDVLSTLGWRRRLGPAHVGIEAVGEDLEGLWEAEEAEGGAKIFVGPSIQLAPRGHAWSASLCGGPILYATRTGRTSLAARPLEATGNGFTVRAAVAYSF